MAQEVYMDIPQVRSVAQQFQTFNEILTQVNKVLEMLSNTLKMTAFMGAVGGLAVAHFIDTIRPYVQQIADKCSEFNRDLGDSVNAFERGDVQGATKFY